MRRPVIYPYKVGSHSARVLARALGTLCVYENGRYRTRKNHLVINWGNPRTPKWYEVTDEHKIVNPWFHVQDAQNKLETFRIFKDGGITCPPWTTDVEEAKQWVAIGGIVLERTLLNSHSGQGINIVETVEQFGRAPLYVLYKKKAREFRVHVFNGEVMDVQQKRKRNDYEGEKDTRIRSYHRGWVYCRENVTEPQGLRELAVNAVASLGLNFGAVDIIWNKREDKCYCLEVNTAPGLEGTTVQSYANAIRRLL